MPETANCPMWGVYGCTVTGASHVRAGLPNQDAIGSHPSFGDAGSAVVLAVSDGHGSKKSFRSDEGARLAVRAATELLQEFDKQLGGECNLSVIAGTAEVDLPRKLVQRWQGTVEDHLAAHPLMEAEREKLDAGERQIIEQDQLLIYGATVLGVLVTPRFTLYLQLGDGDILVVSDAGEVTRPLPPDDRQFANETLSLCSPGASGGKRSPSSASAGAWAEFRIRFQPLEGSSPALILVSTDGYANSFRSENDFLKVGSDLRKMIREEGIGIVGDNLEKWLSEASNNCSGDDVTLGLIYRADVARPEDTPSD
jgi:serine/threonine protein phosphatase PrpC